MAVRSLEKQRRETCSYFKVDKAKVPSEAAALSVEYACSHLMADWIKPKRRLSFSPRNVGDHQNVALCRYCSRRTAFKLIRTWGELSPEEQNRQRASMVRKPRKPGQ